MSDRRRFISQMVKGAALVGFTGLPSELVASRELIKITILHTNDVHSHIDPFPINDPKFPGLGGAEQRMTLINKIRNTEKNVLLFDVGDIFQGTPYFNMYGGELELKLMSAMKYDASTIGNHDFDNGLEGLLKQLPHAKFPFLSANYDFSNTVMNGFTQAFKIFVVDDIRVGVFGLGIELNGLVDKRNYGNTVYLNPLEKAAEISYHLRKNEKCDIIICLSHLGYKYPDDKVSDVVLAKKSMNIDLILGAHTHTFIDTPYRYTNRENKEVLIAQVGWAGIKLGRIDYFIDKKSKYIFAHGTAKTIIQKSC